MMDGLIIELPETTNVTALLFTIKDTVKQQFAESLFMLWQAIKDECERKGLHLENGCYPVTVEMPCGVKRVYDDLSFVPLVDTPCPCGNPDHWLVRWEIE